MSALTAEMLRACLPNAPENDAEEELAVCVAAARWADITTKPRFAAWIAQLGHESGDLYYLEEIADGSDYDQRTDLGNTPQLDGDGQLYKGRGYIQITGRHNYEGVGKVLGLDLVNHPQLLASLPHAWDSAAYYWRFMSSYGDLNIPADSYDFDTTCLGVNGGWNGYQDRLDHYNRALAVLPDDLDLYEEPDQPLKHPSPAQRAKAGVRHYGSGWYVEAHPTQFNFHPILQEMVDRYEAMFSSPETGRDIFICTYWEHPPIFGNQYDDVSFDVWDSDGRGYALDSVLGDEVWQVIYNDPEGLQIEWIIYKGWMWTRTGGWEVYDPPEDGSDPGHWKHIHVSYLVT